jgi:hypothetical protein
MLGVVLSALTGGVSSIATSWKQYLVIGFFIAFSGQTAYLMYVKYVSAGKDQHITKLSADKVLLEFQLQDVQNKFALQKAITKQYNEMQLQERQAKALASKNMEETAAELEKLPASLTKEHIRALNSRLECNLQNFDNLEVLCK